MNYENYKNFNGDKKFEIFCNKFTAVSNKKINELINTNNVNEIEFDVKIETNSTNGTDIEDKYYIEFKNQKLKNITFSFNQLKHYQYEDRGSFYYRIKIEKIKDITSEYDFFLNIRDGRIYTLYKKSKLIDHCLYYDKETNDINDINENNKIIYHEGKYFNYDDNTEIDTSTYKDTNKNYITFQFYSKYKNFFKHIEIPE